jgi:hypothetical protein
MSLVQNEKGIALVTALLFTLISLGIIMMLLYTITQDIKTSGAAKRYQNAREASFGGMEMISKEVIPNMFAGYSTSHIISDYSSLNLSLSPCFKSKLFNATNNWTGCGSNSTSTQADLSPDISFTLKATNDPVGFIVYSKIVDTTCGGNTLLGQTCSNSDPSGVDYLDVGGGVTSSTGTVTPQHLPAYYKIEITGQRKVNPSERSRLSLLYMY